MRIVIENQIDLSLRVKQQKKASIFAIERKWWQAIRANAVQLLAYLAPLAFVVYLISNAKDTWWILIILAVLAWVLAQSWYENRRESKLFRKKESNCLGGRRIEFIEIDMTGICLGHRNSTYSHSAHWLNNAIIHDHTLILTGHFGAVPLGISLLTPQQIQQILYWCNHGTKDFKDQCARCKYDLHGSPGPTCPECGDPIRIDELIAGSHPDALILLDHGKAAGLPMK